MEFHMELKLKKPIHTVKRTTIRKLYDEKLDDGRSVIFDICEIFHETDEIDFIAYGFGSNDWCVDCRYDLPGVIEELPDILGKLDAGDYDFVLDFYEQGTEREIQFVDWGDHVVLICKSRTNWKPVPDRIKMEKDRVDHIFRNLYRRFYEYGEGLCPDLIAQPLREWFRKCK
ncbi:hypothetical protein [Desmospora activa]|uniref:Uncharacterized protein n=1 Tax=Desmospora activa DSM 45169 TaxID=1121389 RepID=A0A2T4Z1Z6_9BACL|nr:hypothetical protein [Desmospora activa]PTM54785.1 hypothetical protein C8J48_3437 [Desmospora activa DSM 45169]